MKIIIQEKAREMLKNKLEPDQFLRVAVAEGGCAGLTYDADFEIFGEKAQNPTDAEVEFYVGIKG